MKILDIIKHFIKYNILMKPKDLEKEHKLINCSHFCKYYKEHKGCNGCVREGVF